MKYLVFTFLIVIINITSLFARNETSKSIDLDSVATVSINLNGNIHIDNSFDDRVHLRTTTKIDGKVIGFSNRDKISTYSVKTEIKNNVLNIAPVQRKKSWAIGLSTLSEENTHYLHIPKNLNVIINSNDAKIVVNGIFSLLKIENNSGQTEVRLTKSKVHYLKVETKNGNVLVNDEEVENKFDLVSKGNSVIDVSTKSGLVKLELN